MFSLSDNPAYGQLASPTGRIAVIGLGYIGLPTAVIFALRGWDVVGVDVSERTLTMVAAGELPFVEEGMDVALKSAVESGRLRVAGSAEKVEVYIIAVPTPFGTDYAVDLSYIDAAVDGIIPQLEAGDLVILESTSPPGTTEHVAERILAARSDLSLDGSAGRGRLDVAHAPERVLPGRILAELESNDRIVGGLTAAASERTREVYSTFCKGEIHLTDARTAEMAKLTENSFRDVNIAFANELSVICDGLDIDVWELISIANRHPRVNVLNPGPGVGGHCIAVDPWFIVSTDRKNSRLIKTAREVNDGKPAWVLDKVAEKLDSLAEDSVIACLGLSYKPDIDDLRESPAVAISEMVAQRWPDRTVLAVEPHVKELPARLANLRNVEHSALDQALERADVVLLLVGHTEFKIRSAELSEDRRIIDTCGVLAG